MMAGDWTTIASPACNAGRQIALRAPFVNNRIDPALYSKPAVYITNKVLASQDGAAERLRFGHMGSGRAWRTIISTWARLTIRRAPSTPCSDVL